MAGVHGLLHENAPNDPCNPSTVLRCHRFSASLVLGFVYAHHLSATYPSRAAKIAAILSTQDKVIELKEKLLAQKQQQKNI